MSWKNQLEIALRNTITNEIITASADGQVKPSQYVEGCVKSILSQISVNALLIQSELIALTDAIGYEEGKHLSAYRKCQDSIDLNCIAIEHKYV